MLSLIVPARERPLAPALEAMASWLERRGPVHEILVVLDGRNEAVEAELARLGRQRRRLRWIGTETPQGEGHAAAQGMLSAMGDRRLLVDPGLLLPPHGESERPSLAGGERPSLAGGERPSLAVLDRALERLDEGVELVIGSRRSWSPRRSSSPSFLEGLSGFLLDCCTRLCSGTARCIGPCALLACSASAAEKLFPRLRIPSSAYTTELRLLAESLGLPAEELPLPDAPDRRTRDHPGSERSGSERMGSDRISTVAHGLTTAMDLLRLRSWQSRGVQFHDQP